jgi:glycerol-3-phosphate dehydrogenase
MSHNRGRLDTLAGKEAVSVLIVGGGINGAGLFRELASQGVDVLLAEKSDFCSGASAAATRVIHGGLRYIENGELRLVRESLGERNRLLANAPHYVKPLAITVPIFRRTSGMLNAARTFFGSATKPGDRGALVVKIGLTLYDLLAPRSQVLPRHRFHSKKEAASLHPGLDPDTLGTATFYDATVSFAERLGLELLLDAERANRQAVALNYMSLEDAAGETVRLRDEQTGRLYSIKPKIVVNATGAWIDFTNRAMGRETQFIGGTKGSHVVLDHPGLLAATGGGMIYFANRDGRICIFYSFFGRVIAGATDIPVSDPDAAICDEAEVDYILDSIRQVLPAIRLDRSHVVFRFCGVRPLPRSDAASPGQVTRDYSYPVVPAGGAIGFPVLSLVGGKWTTFRALGERVADELLRELGRPRQCDTRDLPIGGGAGFPAGQEELERWLHDLHKRTGIPRERLRTLLERYGARAESVSEFLCRVPDRDLERSRAFTQREIEFIATREKVMHLDDLVLRRTILGLLGQVDGPMLQELATVLGGVLGWTEDRAQEEVERTATLLTRVHGVEASRLNP